MMLDAEGKKNFWNQVHENYVQPEVEHRRTLGEIDDNFRIREFRILMPKDQPHIVEFNEEISWVVTAKRGDNEDFGAVGSLVYLHKLNRIESVNPPEVNGIRVAFIFFAWDDGQYKCFADFAPNWTEELLQAHEIPHQNDFSLDSALTNFLQKQIEDGSAKECLLHKEHLRNFGLWLIPSLIPYPLTQIAIHLSKAEENLARELLTAYCTPDYIETLIKDWWEVEEINQRRSLIEEAIWGHKEGKYHLSISTLVPHIEGIITDWELNNGILSKFRIESRIKDFQDKTKGDSTSPYLYMSVQQETLDFILNGPTLSTFKNWGDKIDVNFPNRHAVTHGRYDPLIFTEEASIKIFMLLDTIKQLIVAQGSTSENSA
jgi:hypothetical protein